MGIVYTVDPVNFSVALLKVRPRIAPPSPRLRATAAFFLNHSVLVRVSRRRQFNPTSNPIQSSRNAAATSVNQRPTRERDQPGEGPADRRPRTRHPRRRGGRRQPARDGSADEEVVRRGSTGVVPRRGGVPARAVRGRRRGRGGTKRRGRARRGVGGSDVQGKRRRVQRVRRVLFSRERRRLRLAGFVVAGRALGGHQPVVHRGGSEWRERRGRLSARRGTLC